MVSLLIWDVRYIHTVLKAYQIQGCLAVSYYGNQTKTKNYLTFWRRIPVREKIHLKIITIDNRLTIVQ